MQEGSLAIISCISFGKKLRRKGAVKKQIVLCKDEKVYLQAIITNIRAQHPHRPILILSKPAYIWRRGVYEGQNHKYYYFYDDYIKNTDLAERTDRSFNGSDNAIKLATSPGKITLISYSWGRGTDFTSLDKSVEEAGGIHVIQTFFSLDTSEEVQIRGRTCRQGSPGSYVLILNFAKYSGYFYDTITKKSPTYEEVMTWTQ